MNLKLAWKAVSKGIVDNLPTILTIAAEIGLIGSVVSAAIDSPKAVAKIQEAKIEKAEKIERESESNEALDIYRDEDGVLSLHKIKLTPWEYITVLTPIYWKTGVCVILTGTCIFFSNHINKHRLALLIAALKLKDKEFKEYEEKVKELFGEKKAKEVQSEIAKDWIMNAPENEDDIVHTNRGEMLFYEPLSHTYFKSNQNAVRAAINKANSIGIAQGYLTVTEYCYELDIALRDTYLEDDYQWRFEPGRLQDLLDWREGEWVTDPTSGEPAFVINLNRDPVYTG